MQVFYGFLICIFFFSCFLEFSKRIFIKLQNASHSFLNNTEDCPANWTAYAYSENPKHCIAPSFDHNALYIPKGAHPPALCLFTEELRINHDTLIKIEKENPRCQYL